MIDADLIELRCFFGGGIGVYLTIRDQQIIFLLAVRNKDTQAKDIKKARQTLEQLED